MEEFVVGVHDLPAGAQYLQWRVTGGVQGELLGSTRNGTTFRMARDNAMRFELLYNLAGTGVTLTGEVRADTRNCGETPPVTLSETSLAYPNPAKDFIRLDLPLDDPQGPIQYTLADDRGQTQRQWTRERWQGEVDVRQLRPDLSGKDCPWDNRN